jgi:2-methylcitrate dehydratase
LRGYDYNDLYIGRSAGHPSDMIPGLIGLAQSRRCGGAVLLASVAVGYDIALEFFDHLDLDAHGWDYPVVTALAATGAAAHLLGLSRSAVRESLAIIATTHFVSDELESGELNSRGDLTLWKRFNAGHAVARAIDAVLMAEAGVEGPVRPFEGRSGLLAKLALPPAGRAALIECFEKRTAPVRAGEVTFKRWPVGSRAQSAIQAALQARAALTAAGGDPWQVRRVLVECDAEAWRHLVGSRAAPWHPTTRETADHALPFIVAAAVLDGAIRPESFEPARVSDPARQAFLADRVEVTDSQALSQGSAAGFLAQVTLIDQDGFAFKGEAAPPPGHRLRPFAATDFERKLIDNVAPVLGPEGVARLIAQIAALADAADLCGLIEACRVDESVRSSLDIPVA